MNFLAHLYLSGNNNGLLIGNFIADSVKGNRHELFSDEIKSGIILHRAIDYYSDNHPIFLKSVERLRPKYKKYSGVIVDIFYDYFLATNWAVYSEKSLEQYVAEVHSLMLANRLLLPDKSLMFLKYAITTNRLVSYRSFDGIEEALYGMSRRTAFKSNMELSIEELKKYNSEFENEFKLFFEDARKFVLQWLDSRGAI